MPAKDELSSSATTTELQDMLLAEHLRLLQAGFHFAPVGLCFIDLNHRYVTVNRCFAEMYGLPVDFFIGRTVVEALPAVAGQIIAQLNQSLAADSLVEIELKTQRSPSFSVPADDEILTYYCCAQPMRDTCGTIVGLSVALKDITWRKRAEAALRESEEDLRYTVDLNPHIPFTADSEGNILFLSPRFLSITGLTREQADLQGWVDAIHPDHRSHANLAWQHSVATGTPFDQTYRLRCAGDVWRWVRGRAFPRHGDHGGILRWYGTLEDIHDRKLLDEALQLKTARLEEVSAQLALLVREDHLTGLANRRHFDDALERETARARRSRLPLALIMIDVDHFKRYNDTYGHPAGDHCLRAVAQALCKVLRRQGDLAARYGGEEFVILLPDTPEEGAFEVARHANEAVRALAICHSGSKTGILTISAGVAMAEPDQHPVSIANPLELVQAADQALYAAKSSGRDQVAGPNTLHARLSSEHASR